VTILDRSARWLEEAQQRAAESGVAVSTVVGDLTDPPEPGEYDMVLCHFVLQYRPADNGDLDRLAAGVRPGGLLSVMVPNPASMVLRRLVVDGPAAALAELWADSRTAVTFDKEARKIPMPDLEAALEATGLRISARYGTRVASDLLTDDDQKRDPEYFEELLRLELALCDREPFVRMAGLYQLIATRP
jgi:S-adenosylmethionine-dependent methyltransferase